MSIPYSHEARLLINVCKMSVSTSVEASDTMSTDAEDPLARITAPIHWNISPVTDLSHIEALPPAAKARELKKAADTFASTGRNVFVHYVSPILSARRQHLLESNTTKKKFSKTAAQLWQSVDGEQAFFWTEAARELRLCLKQGSLSTSDCVSHGGRLKDTEIYIWQAEVAVATYLGLPAPLQNPSANRELKADLPNESSKTLTPKRLSEKLDRDTVNSVTLAQEKKAAAASISTSCISTESSDLPNDVAVNLDLEKVLLLDTLPERFECQPRMLYSHFAHYDHDEVRMAEGKHQTAMLRQLADLFDKTGKMLFYYYVVPWLCKQCQPPTSGDTVTSKAADTWRFLSGREKGEWLEASASMKQRLGDGDVQALEVLQLDGLGDEVLRLHELARTHLRDSVAN